MPEYLTPGLYVEEVDSGSKPIEGVGTNTCAFIGYAKSGPFNQPIFVSSWTQFCEDFGQDENRLLTALAQEFGSTTAQIKKAKDASRKGWMDFAAKQIKEAVADTEAFGTKGGISVRTFQDFLKKYNIPATPTPYINGSYLAHSVFGYYQNGGGRCYIVRVPFNSEAGTAVAAGANGASANGSAHSTPRAIAPTRAAIGPMTFTARDTTAKSGEITVEAEPVDGDEFRIKVTRGDQSEVFPKADGKMKLDAVATQLNRSKIIGVEVRTDPAFKFEPFKISLEAVPVAPEVSAPASTTSGGLPALKDWTETATNALSYFGADIIGEAAEADFIGDEATRRGAGGLSTIEDINMIAIPDLMAGAFRHERIKLGPNEVEGDEEVNLTDARRQAILDMQVGLVGYCERMADRIAILDPLPGLKPQEMRDTTNNTPYGCDKGHAAIYYPWIKITDPLRKGKQLFVPPSGHVAGIYARVGAERGVHKAPANEVLRGAVAMEVDLTRADQAILNPDGINAIRFFPSEGIKVYGARTLATIGNPSWKYVNVRRLFDYLEKSIEKSIGWAVFEPNDEDLWGRLRRNISAFLFTEWKTGKLFGSVPAEAFYVKCDFETNPQEMIDLGRVYVEVGINPVKPAEFVIIRMGQWSSGGSVAEQ